MSSIYSVKYQLRSHRRDAFIEFIKSMLMTPFVLHSKPRYDSSSGEYERSDVTFKANEDRFCEILLRVEDLIEEHRRKTSLGLREHSRLYNLVPSIGSFFTHLSLKDAFLECNSDKMISARRFVPPSFNEIREILNVAQLRAISKNLKLITFDGDMTLYDDQQDFEYDSDLVHLIVKLLEHDKTVAVVTAASYGDEASKYEGRLKGLLKGFSLSNLTQEQLHRFFVFGGESNYLFRCNDKCHLDYIDESVYLETASPAWPEDQVVSLLNVAEKNLRRCVEEMKLSAKIIRKSRAVGLIPGENVVLSREQLDECVLSTQSYVCKLQNIQVSEGMPRVPFCAFNGGRDAWVDIGNKFFGVEILKKYIGANPEQTIHFGDQVIGDRHWG
ncbi:IMP 5'-nucleotidase [Entomophthora muscae]|uniref:IMP 5'-nucleotidase n=1 Tax=Entomophthora muscae TaxID=34485 RepID=A0ACC2T4F2_9FUNG|nr:IMP 5'-nucleotidase [Entomophthora muscae]